MLLGNAKIGDVHIAGSGALQYGPFAMDPKGLGVSVPIADTFMRETRSFRHGLRIYSSTIDPCTSFGLMAGSNKRCCTIRSLGVCIELAGVPRLDSPTFRNLLLS